MADRSHQTPLVQFNERLTNSAAFTGLFREGMDLVEETAAYLDGVGRDEGKALERSAGLTYATESMRLTTRLMQLASWLLLPRAVKEGEMTLNQANREKTKDRPLDGVADPGAPARRHDPRRADRAPCHRQSAGAAAQPAEGRVRGVGDHVG